MDLLSRLMTDVPSRGATSSAATSRRAHWRSFLKERARELAEPLMLIKRRFKKVGIFRARAG